MVEDTPKPKTGETTTHVTTAAAKERSSNVNDAPNCSAIRIIDNEAYLYGKTKLYYTIDYEREIDWRGGKCILYANTGTEASLNQSVDSTGEFNAGISVGLNTAFEVFHAFEEIDKENERRVSQLFIKE
jgi:hypothetical protein